MNTPAKKQKNLQSTDMIKPSKSLLTFFHDNPVIRIKKINRFWVMADNCIMIIGFCLFMMKKEPCDTSEHNVALQALRQRQILKIKQTHYEMSKKRKPDITCRAVQLQKKPDLKVCYNNK